MLQPTSFDTYSVVASGSNTPTPIAKTRDISVRAQVSNVGPVVVFVADDVTDLVPAPTTDSYRILPGEQHVLVLTPKQSLYAVGAGTGGTVSVTLSEILAG